MKRLTALYLVVLSLALSLAGGCSGGGAGSDSGQTGSASSSSGTTGSNPEGSTTPAPETTQEAGTTEETSGRVPLEQISSGSGGLGQRQVVVAPSAGALSEATGAQVPDAGEGTYLAAFWGEKPTGGYTMEILSALMEGNQIIVRIALKDPPPDAMVSQALTYPYAAAVIRGGVPADKELTFVTQGGRELNWPIRNI